MIMSGTNTETAAGSLPTRTPTLRASFTSADEMQRAIDQLGVSGFDHADIALIEGDSRGEAIPREGDSKAAYDEADARQARTLHASGAATAAGLAAAGITVATGGLAAVAIGAAVVAGAAAGGITHAVSTAANQSEQLDRDAKAADGQLVLSVQIPTPEKQARAADILRQAGARDITLV
jgi:hypothetical protein